MIRFLLNEKEVFSDLPPGTLLLDYIRYHKHLTGTKIGCREGDCGACTVLIGELRENELVYTAATSCLMALANVQGKHVVTVEGLNMKGLNAIQQAMSDEAATQCGFCTPGFVVSLAGFCLSNTEHNDENAIAAINGNICRCTGYKSIEKAAGKVAEMMRAKGEIPAIEFACDNKFLPSYFKEIKNKLAALPTNGRIAPASDKKRYLGGGTDLYVQQPEAMASSEVEPLFWRHELNGISVHDGKCYIGASATVTDVLSSPVFQQYFPELKKFIKLVSSTPIRNMATIGGNFVNASPIGDMTIFFLALNAQIILSDSHTQRELPLRNLYLGYKQLDKKPEEFIKAIYFECKENTRFNFEKVSKRTHLDIASVNTAMQIVIDKNIITAINISAGGVAPIPMYLQNTAAYLIGKNLSEETILSAVETAQAEISPISDVRGSEAYKRLLLGQLIKAHFTQLFPSLSIDKLLATA